MSLPSPAQTAADVLLAKQAEALRNDELLAEVKALMKRRREEADYRLREWGKERERIGFSSLSISAKIKLERDGASHRAVAILGDGCLNQVERQSERLGRVLQIERFVRMMPSEWIVIVVGIYVEQRSQVSLAADLKIERNRIIHRLHDAQERIIAEIEAQAVSLAMKNALP